MKTKRVKKPVQAELSDKPAESQQQTLVAEELVAGRKRKRQRGDAEAQPPPAPDVTPQQLPEAEQPRKKRRKKAGGGEGLSGPPAASTSSAPGAPREVAELAATQAAPEPKAVSQKTKVGKSGKKSAEQGQVAGHLPARETPAEKKVDPSGASAAAAPVGPEDFTVFVDGVPYTWSQAQLEEFFASCGVVTSVRAPTWQDSGRLRGYAHVSFADAEGKRKALKLDGTQIGKKGRYLKIEPAKAPGSAEAGGSSEPKTRADVKGKTRLFVKNLPYDVLEAEVGELFQPCGKVREVRIPTDRGRSKGFAYVEFATPQQLLAALNMQPAPSLRGRVLRLDADAGSGPKAGFHYRPEAYESPYLAKGKGKTKGGKGGKGGGRGGGDGGRGAGRGVSPGRLLQR